MGCACGGNCACNRAESSPLPADPRVSPMDDGLHLPADSPALDLPRENAEIGGVDFKADSSPLPADPRVSPLKKGLYTPSDTPEMAAEGNSYTNYQPLPEWPPAARHIITGLSKWERDESDKYRCGPVYLIDGEWSWCNGGSGDLGHIDGGGGSGPLCSYCGMNMETGSFSAESFGAEDKELTLENLPKDSLLNMIESSKDIITFDGDKEELADIEVWDDFDEENFGTVGEYYQRFIDGVNISRQSRNLKNLTLENLPKDALLNMIESSKDIITFYGDKEDLADREGWEDDFDEENFGTVGEYYQEFIDGANRSRQKNAESFGAESAFDRLEDEVADEYEEKGMSDKEAQKVGAAVAYKQGVKKYGKKIMSESARKGVSAKSLKRAEIGPHVPTRIGATTTQRGVVKTYDSIPAGDGHVVGQFTANMDYAPSGMYGAESITDGIAKGFGSVLGIISGLIISGFAMNAVSTLTSDDEN